MNRKIASLLREIDEVGSRIADLETRFYSRYARARALSNLAQMAVKSDEFSSSFFSMAEKKYREERFKHPLYGKDPLVTREDVSFFTLKDWLSSEDDTRREYARKIFSNMQKELQGEEGSLKDLVVKRDGASYLDALDEDADISDKDFERIAEMAKSNLATGYAAKNGLMDFYTSMVTDEIPRNAKALITELPARAWGLLKKGVNAISGIEFQDELSKNPEARESMDNYLLNYAQSTFIPLYLGVKGVAATVAGGIAGAVGAPAIAGAVGALVIGSVLYKKLLFQKKRRTKGDTNAQMVQSIYEGYSTPKSIEDEYSGKLNKILEDFKGKSEEPSRLQSLLGKKPTKVQGHGDPKRLKEEIRALQQDFDKNARPNIEKAMYLQGKTNETGGEGVKGLAKELASRYVKMLKRGGFFDDDPEADLEALLREKAPSYYEERDKKESGESFKMQEHYEGDDAPLPVSLRLKTLLDTFQMEEDLLEALSDPSTKEELLSVLKGEQPLDEDVIKKLQSAHEVAKGEQK